MLAVEMRGGKLAGRDREALEAYLLSLAPFDRRRLEPDGAPVEPSTLSARRGYAVFAKAECTDCHPAPVFARASSSTSARAVASRSLASRCLFRGALGPTGAGRISTAVRALAHNRIELAPRVAQLSST
jgi:hypothetical protein